MAWTYSGNPSSTTKDAVRFLVGDTVATEPLATDEEIAWALSIQTDIHNASALVARSIATKFATMKVSVKIGPIAEEYGNRAEFYSNRAKELESYVSQIMALDIYAGGISKTDRDNVDPDKQTSFSIGMTDNTGAYYPTGGNGNNGIF